MALLIFAIVVLLIAGLLIYAVDLLPGFTPPFTNIVKLLIIIIAIIVIADRVM